MEWKEFSAKTTNEALTNALIEFNTSSDKVEYEVVEKESSKLLGLINKPAIIRVRLKMGYEEIAKDFLVKVFHAMNMEVEVEAIYHEDENTMDIELTGNEMGILIGKRGNTLDSLQYLVSLAVNRNSESYIKVKLDTENYRERRKETLENLAHNLAHKVKRIHKPVYLEPMNPYERRIIHSALQKDKYVETHSEGEEPYRKVVITLKDGVDTGYENRGRYSRNRSYGKNNYRKPYNKKNAYNRDESVEETVSTDVEA
ncbi:RNA-binding cell elongation regulator Jag/EloR [Jutongia hominis]|uniref:RNA-binding protein KhpB n=1 Tax=Jutongia hominis TaxID=2763664 RepID=A0ABR7MV35_9FIRM|nr:RNA-binding cell elongation regulator Jag/EloR [Jutongia hominis]MBC8557655.1 protein jag [Jutongia hominis]MEE0289103.1 RNA-binding cell elongation regulator Jag/EloR [Lachnospiraceae bacterium]PWL70721.1 MAG: DNA-binding protein [Clostridiaceae bacterium]